MRTVSIRLADLEKVSIQIGFVGENLYTQVRIDCLKLYEEYPSAVPSLTIKPPKGDSYPAVVTRENNTVIWNVSNSDLVHQGSGELQLAFIVDEIVAKSYVGRLHINRSLVPDGEAPDVIQNWIDEANAALGTIQGAVTRAENAADASETAQGKAETAQDKAEDAQEAAEAAQGYAEAAKNDAESARDLAQGYKDTALSAKNAAEAWATGGSSGTPSATNNAMYYASLAEQSANVSGFMDFEIDENGRLIYTRTDQVGADFEIDEDGHLLLETA